MDKRHFDQLVHKILQDNRLANSLTKILNLSGVENVKRNFSDSRWSGRLRAARSGAAQRHV